MRGLTSLMESARGGSPEEGLAGWAKYQLNVSRNVAGIYLKADTLKLAHDGDSKDGTLHIQLLGMQMANPFVASKGAEVVLVADVSDEIQPRAELAANGRATESSFDWGANMAVRQPVTGAFWSAARVILAPRSTWISPSCAPVMVKVRWRCGNPP